MTIVTSLEQLEALYAPAPAAASTVKVARRMTPEYRRLVANAILWTLGREVPAGGAPAEVPAETLEL